MDNTDTRKLLFNQQLSQNHIRAQLEAKRELNKALHRVHTEVKNRIKYNNLFEPTEIAKCITRATFSLIAKEEGHNLSNPDGTSLPPFHREFLSCLVTESDETINEIVKAICLKPQESDHSYVEWLKEERRKRFPENRDWAPESGLQLGSFGTDTLARVRDDLMSMGVTPALNKVFARASTVVDEIRTLIVNGSTSAITISAALKSSAVVTGGYCLYKIGYNAYRVVKHGRSLKYAVKNVVDETGSVAVANIVGVASLVGLSASFGGLLAALFGIGLGALVSRKVSPRINWISRKMLNISDDEYLDKAYRHFSVSQDTPLKAIFKEYRRLSRDNHEDKVRDKPQNEIDNHKRIFLKTQYAMAMISAAVDKNEDDYQLARYNFERADKEEYGGDLIADSWSKIKGWFKGIWKGYDKKGKDPRVLEITSGLLPYDLFLEEEEFERLEEERLEKRIVGMAENTKNAGQTNSEDENMDLIYTETLVEDLERLLGE